MDEDAETTPLRMNSAARSAPGSADEPRASRELPIAAVFHGG